METDPQIQAALAQLSMPNLPVYRVDGCLNPFSLGEPASLEVVNFYNERFKMGLTPVQKLELVAFLNALQAPGR